MTLSEMQTMAYDDSGFDPLVAISDARVVRRFLANLNQFHRFILGKKGMERYRRRTVTFSSVANSPYAVMPQSISRILALADRTNNQFLSPTTLPDIIEMDPGRVNSSGNPWLYLIDNLRAAVKLEPSNASELFFKSDAAGDGATKEMFIQGIITGGEMRTASAAMNGVTAVSFGATLTSWIAVDKLYLALAAGGATTAAGNITIHEDSGLGTELGRILPGKTATSYSRIQLYPTPTAVVVYHADVELNIVDFAEAGDTPLFHEDYHWLLPCGAVIKELRRKEKTAQAKELQTVFKQGLSDLYSHTLSDGADEVMGRSLNNQLGPWFPAA